MGTKTTQPSAGQTVRVLQITDTHLFTSGSGRLLGLNTEQSLSAVLAAVAGRNPAAHLVLATGDLAHDGTPGAYQRFFRHMNGLGLPVYCLPGNHDEAGALRRAHDAGQCRYNSHAVHGDWHFILLDSTVPGSEGGHLSDATLAMLEQRLQAEPDRHTIVCLHHQPVAMGSQWLDTMAVDNPADFFAIIDRHPQVRAILWGHVHQELQSRRGDVLLLSTPSTCIQFLPGSTRFAVDTAPPGYRWLELQPDGRIVTGIERIGAIPGQIDLAAGGY
ncbi:MAG: 3',5'-cyclic-AMP phosphodiesterase [Pseudomonadota bacterium]